MTISTEKLKERISHLKEWLRGMKQHKHPDDCPNAALYLEGLKAEKQQDIDLLTELLAVREAQSEPVQWGAPKTVRQLIQQLQTLDQDLETTALLRMPADFRDGNAIRQVPLSISYERMNGQWLAQYKGDGRLVLAFWAKADDRPEGERGELLTAPPAPAVPDAKPEIDYGEGGSDIDYMQPQQVYDMGKIDGWNACRAAMLTAKTQEIR
jgi:hypothetical protein